MKLEKVLEKLTKDAILNQYTSNGKPFLDIRITPEQLAENLNELAIDFHNLVEEKRLIKVKEPKFTCINLDSKQQTELENFIDKK